MAQVDFAPQDPTEKGAYFYIMKDKDIQGTQQPDGGYVQFIYQDDGRLINASRICGGIEDDAILDMLRTTAEFRKLVAAIGVSVQTTNFKEKVTFSYQMYGNKDKYSTGTTISSSFITNGLEQIIDLDSVDWSDDDMGPGQLRFTFEKKNVKAQATVRFYLREGYDVPEPIVDTMVDESSPEYKLMILRSLLSMGNPTRIKRAIDRAKNGEDITIAFIGGSITQGAGAIPINTNCYAYRCFENFATMYGSGKNVHLVKAGVGGTPSELGIDRFEQVVLSFGEVNPDIVVIEFAVNDHDDETEGEFFESLVRKALKLPNHPGVALLFSVFANDENLQDRLIPIGKKYDLPMVSLKNAVTDQFRLRAGLGRVLSKNQFFYDIFHPTNLGHKIMSDCLLYMFKEIDQNQVSKDDCTEALLREAAVYGKRFDDIRYMDRSNSDLYAKISCGDFDGTDKDLQCCEMNDVLDKVPQFPDNWNHNKGAGNEAFEMDIIAKSLVMVHKDSGETCFGKADVFVDEVLVKIIDPLAVGWTHCNAKIVFSEETAVRHHIKVAMHPGDEDKAFTILGFGVVE